MRFGALPTLQAVVRRGNFAAAAQELGLTPSAVSQQMRQLEDWFGQPLFDRSARSVKPTPFALDVVSRIEGALDGLQELRDRGRPDVGGRLRIGVINSVQLSTLPRILRAVARRFPTLQLTLEPANTSERLLESLKAGDIDAAIVVKPHAGISRKFVADEIAQEPFLLVSPPDFKGALTIQHAVQQLPWVRYNINLDGGRVASTFVRRVSPGLQPKYEMMTTDAVIGMVSEGLGFSVVPEPRPQIMTAFPVRSQVLDRQVPRRSIVLARRASDAESRRVDALLACIREVYAGLKQA